MTTTVTEPQLTTPFETAGGGERIHALVERFYDLLDAEPAYAALRDLHAPDLTSMRASLTGFLTAWLGGPRDWFAQRPGVCMMSAHAQLAITNETASQWVEAMARALTDTGIEPQLAARMQAAFERMAQSMAR